MSSFDRLSFSWGGTEHAPCLAFPVCFSHSSWGFVPCKVPLPFSPAVQTPLAQVHIRLLSSLRAERSCRTEPQGHGIRISWAGREPQDHRVQLLELQDAAPETGTDVPVLCTSPISHPFAFQELWCYFNFQSIYDPTDKLNWKMEGDWYFASHFSAYYKPFVRGLIFPLNHVVAVCSPQRPPTRIVNPKKMAQGKSRRSVKALSPPLSSCQSLNRGQNAGTGMEGEMEGATSGHWGKKGCQFWPETKQFPQSWLPKRDSRPQTCD